MFNHHHPGAGELLTDHDFRTEMLVRSDMLTKFHFAVYGGWELTTFHRSLCDCPPPSPNLVSQLQIFPDRYTRAPLDLGESVPDDGFSCCMLTGNQLWYEILEHVPSLQNWLTSSPISLIVGCWSEISYEGSNVRGRHVRTRCDWPYFRFPSNGVVDNRTSSWSRQWRFLIPLFGSIVVNDVIVALSVKKRDDICHLHGSRHMWLSDRLTSSVIGATWEIESVNQVRHWFSPDKSDVRC